MTGTSGRTTSSGPGGPGPDRLSEWVGARAAPDTIDAARLLEQADGRRPELTTKRSLVGISHAIERAVLAAPHAEPTIVLALFQRMEYFERERVVYERIARTGASVAIGFCDGPGHPLPDGVSAVALDGGEALVNEWSVVAVTRQAGAFLVATDQHSIEPGSSSLEAGRRFRSRWGFSRVQATVELARLRLVLGERLPIEMVRTIDRLLGETMAAGAQPASSGGSPQEIWATTAAFHLAERLSSERTGSAALRAQLADANAAAAARRAAGIDQQSGLTTPEFLHRWSDGAGTTVLPVGIGLLDLPAVAEAGRDGTDPRAAYHAARRIAAALTQPLGPVDAAIRLSEREFLVVLPGASELHLARVCDEVLEQLTLASEGYPYVQLTGRLATTVTRHRPLPLADLRRAIGDVDPSDPTPRSAGHTASGDLVVICATRSTSDDDDPIPDDGADRPDGWYGTDGAHGSAGVGGSDGAHGSAGVGGSDGVFGSAGAGGAEGHGGVDGEHADGTGGDGDSSSGARGTAGSGGNGSEPTDRGDAGRPGWDGLQLSGGVRLPRPFPGSHNRSGASDETPVRGTWAGSGDPPASPRPTDGHEDDDHPDPPANRASRDERPDGAGPRSGSAVDEVRNLFGRRS